MLELCVAGPGWAVLPSDCHFLVLVDDTAVRQGVSTCSRSGASPGGFHEDSVRRF